MRRIKNTFQIYAMSFLLGSKINAVSYSETYSSHIASIVSGTASQKFPCMILSFKFC